MSPDGSLALARSDATKGSSAKSAIVPGKIATHDRAPRFAVGDRDRDRVGFRHTSMTVVGTGLADVCDC
jgi:hypothetical protein